ncbi:MAG TPA: galactitol-1-phosphate 5-dehydrogenase [Candidatus Hydrogenedentes bacterium]|nr:galactitol-1-phosphate 5-dehydrogenase [Candidatus Hydrogenedentota bacterium]HNT87534.1 galactitol-1-phosphate 5-dehydrogenase [Candidatus Hydrogenedentota bacterium]
MRVAACGVCGSDLPRVFSKGTYRFPLIPGHELAGTVEAVGAEVDSSWVGRRVAVFPLIPCRRCAACESGAYAQCADYDYLGSRRDGGFAEFTCMPAWNLLPVPDGLPLHEAAMLEPAAVALHALRRARLDAGDSVLIMGAGPIGLLLAMWARVFGAGKILIADINIERLRFARTLKFDHLHDAGSGDTAAWARRKTAERGADVVIEATGASAALEQCVLAACAFGRVVLLGNPAGAMTLSQAAYWAVLRRELRMIGSWNSSYSELPRNEWRLALECMADGRIEVGPLVTHQVPLENLRGRIEMLRYRKGFACKVMCVPRG